MGSNENKLNGLADEDVSDQCYQQQPSSEK